jgi:hypothetical protein
MAELPRLNGVVGALEKGRHALTTFTPADTEAAVALATAKYDAVVYEMEHNAYDIRAFRDCRFGIGRRESGQSMPALFQRANHAVEPWKFCHSFPPLIAAAS